MGGPRGSEEDWVTSKGSLKQGKSCEIIQRPKAFNRPRVDLSQLSASVEQDKVAGIAEAVPLDA